MLPSRKPGLEPEAVKQRQSVIFAVLSDLDYVIMLAPAATPRDGRNRLGRPKRVD
jgi:hypothetical protein